MRPEARSITMSLISPRFCPWGFSTLAPMNVLPLIKFQGSSRSWANDPAAQTRLRSIRKSNGLVHRLRAYPVARPVRPGTTPRRASAQRLSPAAGRHAREKAPCLYPFHPKGGRGRGVVKHTRVSCALPRLDKVLWRALGDDSQCPPCRMTRQAHERQAVGSTSLPWHPPPCLRLVV